MPRKRLLSPEFFTHSDLYEAEVSAGLPLRLAFAGLWCQADKRGIFRWRPRELKLAILPYDAETDFEALLDALEHYGFIRGYSIAGKEYGFIPSFGRWQTFHRMEGPSSDPEPPPEVAQDADLTTGRLPRGWIPRDVRAEVMARDGARCVQCQSTQRLSLDHIVPYSKGGTNEASNLRVLCRSCNSRKGYREVPSNHATGLQRAATSLQHTARPLQQPATTPVTGTVTSTGTVTNAVASTASVQQSDGVVLATDGHHRKRLTAAANKGIAEQFGEQPVPIRWDHAGTHRGAEALEAAAVPLAFAERALYHLAKQRQPADGRPPRTLSYYTGAVVDLWRAEEAHRDAATLPTPADAGGVVAGSITWDDLFAKIDRGEILAHG